MFSNILSFHPKDTKAQKVFDIIFGIVAPILCVAFDPGVIRAPENVCGGTGSILTDYTTFVYTAIGLGIFALTVWMAAGSQLKNASSFFAGIFFTGFVFSLVVGIAILPLSLIGLVLMGLGLLGFIPFLTALVFLRNGIKALQWTRESTMSIVAIKIALAIIGATIVLGIPAYMQYQYPPEKPAMAVCAE
jgi:hypothetical protein